MNTTAGATLTELHTTLSELAAATSEPENLTGETLRKLATTGTALFTFLRLHLAETTDPRLALELATTGQQLEDEAARIRVTGADRLAATNAHTLDETELDSLRTTAPDTTRQPHRCAGKASFQTPAALLASWTHIPFGEASKLIGDASDLISRRDMAGNQLPPRFEHLATLFTTPDTEQSPALHPAVVREISQKLAKREPKDQTFDGIRTEPTLFHADGRPVEEHAATLLTGGQSVAETNKQVKELITTASTTAGTATSSSLRRGFFPLPIKNEFTREFLLRVTTVEGEYFDSLAAHAANGRTLAGAQARVNRPPQTGTVTEADTSTESSFDEQATVMESTEPAPAEVAPAVDEPTTNPETPDEAAAQAIPAEPSILDFLPEGALEEAIWEPETTEVPATVPERALNALMDILTLVPTGGGGSQRIRPEVLVHLELENLQDLASGDARTAHGVKLPPGDLRRLLCEADIIPAIFNSKSELLDYGRAQRLVPERLKRAVLARDHGCIVPGCTEPPEKIEFHHIDPWWMGGETKLINLAGLCRGGHMDADSGRIRVVMVEGLPHVILPKHIDPAQKPRRNTYWD
ncbi:HNH endonuclease signature motif containing protein [Arthrobacter sp. MYb213]|uniref:HNH endonuclease signature motif containing protein n=1 Tax=Arthrobacter sp. MYb213 TaxID=1848595 RepID=UPI0011B04652|nr:HNH endonuclease signature motif containing protein [Arthrobacter sp. MYb213]